jgi:exopolysaccharide biosynthesis polyprenyl glycosylphosphotransferase
MRFRLYVFTAIADALCLIGSFMLAGLIRFGDPFSEHALLMANIFVAVYMLAALNVGTYSIALLDKPVRAIRQSLTALGIAALAILGMAFYLKVSADLSRLTLTIGAASAALSLTLTRVATVRLARKAFGRDPFSVVEIHDESAANGEGSSRVFLNGKPLFLGTVEFLDPQHQHPVMYQRLAEILEGADRAVIFCPPERRMAWSQALKGACVQGEIVASELEPFGAVGIGSARGTPTLVVSEGALDLPERALKRALDLAVAGTALILLAPLLILVAIAIKLDSPGPVFFMQPRIGRGNKMFNVRKFRSMRSDNCDVRGDRSTGRTDDRITRVGRWIRKTSVDELPQLLNVLNGDMSIVGPRPHAVGSRAADKLFWEIDQRYWHRHGIKPGLTGLAQVRGYRGATEVERDLLDRLQSDLEYVHDWSVWRDLRIILLTIPVIFHRNAY